VKDFKKTSGGAIWWMRTGLWPGAVETIA